MVSILFQLSFDLFSFVFSFFSFLLLLFLSVLTPIGHIQQSARAWVGANQGLIGKMLATVAVLLPFEAGWVPPRQLYASDIFRVWGTLPYGPGDHLTHAIFDLL